MDFYLLETGKKKKKNVNTPETETDIPETETAAMELPKLPNFLKAH